MTIDEPAAGLPRAQWAVLRAAVDRIIPPDDEMPGGVDAGAFDYLLRQLGPGGDLNAILPDYTIGLAALDDLAMTVHGEPFSTLESDRQDDILRAFAGREGRFFSALVEQAQEGFYTSPAGLAMIGWKVTG